MKLPSTSNPNKGFTLIEVLIAIGIIFFLGGMGLFLSMDFYRTFSFRSDNNTVVSILHKARMQALSNIDLNDAGGKDHGVHYDAVTHQMTIFEGSSYGSEPAQDEDIRIDSNLIITWPGDIVFKQLTGCLNTNCDSPTQVITVVNNGQTSNISINNEGSIDY